MQRVGADHPVVEGEPGTLQPPDLGVDPDPDDDHVGPQFGAVRQTHLDGGRTLLVREHLLETRAGAQLDAVVAVQLRAGLSHLLAQHPSHRGGQRLDHGHLGTESATGGGHLEPDETGADHHHLRPFPRRVEPLADREAVVEGPQRADTGHPVGPRQPARAGTGRHDQPVEGELGPVVEANRTGAGVEGGRAMAEPELEAEGVEHVGRVVVDPLEVPDTGEELLRQRGPVVGGVPLVAHDDDRTLVLFVSELLGGAQPGERGADHEDRCIGIELLWHRRHRRGAAGHRPFSWNGQLPNMVIHCSGVRSRKT